MLASVSFAKLAYLKEVPKRVHFYNSYRHIRMASMAKKIVCNTLLRLSLKMAL